MLIDTHCHLTREDYQDYLDILNNKDCYMIANGCNDKTNLEVLDLIEKYNNIYGAIGIHPEDVDNINLDSFKLIEDNLKNNKIVAIGEIGLDYYYCDFNKEKQKEVFIKQLDLAEKYNKPVIIHSRDSIQDVYDILKNYNLKGSIHCFSSSLEMAELFIKLGYSIGVGGVVTFKNGKKIQNIVENIDIDNILMETDSPYLTPEPYRGTVNKPANVYYVACKISEIKHIPLQEVIDKLNSNAIRLFDLNI